MADIHKIDVFNFKLETEKIVPYLPLSYQVFGPPLGIAPVVVINHALTGNSNISGEKGWWKSIVDYNKVIDLNLFTVIVFNIPGNGYADSFQIQNYQDFSTRDIAKVFWEGLDTIGVHEIFALLGGSLGGGIAWEMAFLRPKAIQNLIPIAAHWKADDWLIANVHVQSELLLHSEYPLEIARKHAMLLYRSPESLVYKFQNEKEDDSKYAVQSWLDYHGQALAERFSLSAYKLMNHLLGTIGKTSNERDLQNFLDTTSAVINQISISTDYLFVATETKKWHAWMEKRNSKVFLNELDSIHGHDAFLIEYEILKAFLEPVFDKVKLTASLD
ncbi:alpha/beta fold hydrolase [Flavobacterium columnare]|uniref:Alpha/beta fold hydrolase n=1 Tax=Flavobacterium columnare TaxID=996 RepID=A0AA94F365_9FLAO|nr:alpha/beta fold hydrolase [Flavobacterium columnare]MCH4829245.1 alpha/beta fold hydrolase [Flavobacterium columnare]MCH4834021.1 alpha/beta fold hydrolase [Flavobacterium columnare]